MAAGHSDPPNLQAELAHWLNGFERQEAIQGREFHAAGRVTIMESALDHQYPEAWVHVRDRVVFDCTVTHDVGDDGWYGECSCPDGFECKHLYAAGLAVLERLAGMKPGAIAATAASLPASPTGSLLVPARAFLPATPPAPPTGPPDEQALVALFIERTGAPPERKQLAFLRNLLALHRALRSSYGYNPVYQVNQALQNLLPATHRFAFDFYGQPFADRWQRPPATPLELWSYVALAFTEKGVPLPAFMAPLTDVETARAAVVAYRRERELAAWRARFIELENSIPPAAEAPPPLQSLRLRLGRKKPVWEMSARPAADPGAAPAFQVFTATELRNLLYQPGRVALLLDAASTSFAALLDAHQRTQGRLALKLTDHEDRALIGRVLNHPLARTCIVDDLGRAIQRDPRPLVWQFHDHPTDPSLALAQLGFADGTPAPGSLLYLPAKPALYLHEATLFSGLPPPASAAQADPATPVPIPRAALALPEAGRFAARAGLALPNAAAGRFRRETLRPRVRARLAPRRPDVADDVLLVELVVLAPDGTPRALYEEGRWRRDGPGLPPPPADAAFLILDFEPTHAAVIQFNQLSTVRDAWHPDGPRVHVEINPYFVETFPKWIAGFPSNTLIELAPELAAFAQPPTRAHFALDISAGDEASGIDWFDVRVTLRAEDTTLTPEELALLRAASGRFVRLTGRGWRRLELEVSSVTDEKLAQLGLDADTAAAETAREPLRFHALQLADEALRDALPERLWAEVRARAAALRSPEPPPIPPGLTGELRPYQRDGFHFLAFLTGNRFGGVLADDMGLGKTLQALAWFLWLADRTGDHRPLRALVVCPKSVMVNWQLETARFAPALTTALLTPRANGSAVPSGAHLVVVNYAQLRLHADALAAETWDAVVLDEGQNIKNPLSATAQAARALRTAHRLVLTGTPIENRLLDLWSLFAFAQPGLLGGQTAFKRLYNDKADPTGARTRLAHRVKHFLLRRTKSQVARDLPARIEEDIVVELEGTQRTLYDAELKRTRQLLLGVKSAREFDTQRFNILQSLLRLRQICCDARLIGAGDRTPDPTDTRPPSAKLDALLDTLEPLAAEGHKVLVFSQFVTMLELIRAELIARGIAYLLLTGQTENRQALVDRFQTDATIPVFLLSLKAAGSGLNLTAASYVVLYDPWWNPAVEAQAIDRTHRIGQRNQVIAYRLLARGTVEEKIRALQREKSALAAAVVQEESLATVLDLDSLRQILG